MTRNNKPSPQSDDPAEPIIVQNPSDGSPDFYPHVFMDEDIESDNITCAIVVAGNELPGPDL